MEIEITNPDDCIVGWCLPLTKADYVASVADKERGDFIRLQLSNSGYTAERYWDEIYKAAALDFELLLTEVEKVGVKVIRNFVLTDLTQISKCKVFTIFAHYSDDDNFIELTDGLFSSEEFANSIPHQFDGLFDLTACNSACLRNSIRAKRNIQIISFNLLVRPRMMLVFYKNLVSNLSLYECNFLDCYTKMIGDFGEAIANRKI